MNEKRKWIIRGSVIVLVGFILAFCVVNAVNNTKFWEFNVFNGFTMLWSIGVSFLLTRFFSRQQRHADIIVKIIQELITNIDESKTCNISTAEGTNQLILMQNRQMRQQINLLNQYAKKFGFEKDLQLIAKEFDEYEQFISDHISDLEYLSKSRNELSRPIKLMREQLYSIIMKL